MMTTTNNIDLELTEAELEHVVGGDTALQHEGVHADHTGISIGNGHTPIAIIAILIG